MVIDQLKTMKLLEPFYSLEICHDPFNKRVRVDDYHGNIRKVLRRTEKLADDWKVEKIIIKGRQEDLLALIESGYTLEASIDDYFLGSPCYFFTKYLSLNRKTNSFYLEGNEIIEQIYQLEKANLINDPPQQYTLSKATEHDAKQLATLYAQVFQIYPTPLNNEAYIKQTMREGTIYYYYSINGEIVSAASAEVNDFYKNAEITDCATLPEHRKFGLLKSVIAKLEEDLQNKGIFCVYSIARALSFGMNAALYQLHYNYRGRLINNCFIFDKIEDMNVWVKNLAYMPKYRR